MQVYLIRRLVRRNCTLFPVSAQVPDKEADPQLAIGGIQEAFRIHANQSPLVGVLENNITSWETLTGCSFWENIW